jgi:hypothetical protein
MNQQWPQQGNQQGAVGANPYAAPQPLQQAAGDALAPQKRSGLAWAAIVFTGAMGVWRLTEAVIFLFVSPSAVVFSLVSVLFYAWATRGLLRGSRAAYQWALRVNILLVIFSGINIALAGGAIIPAVVGGFGIVLHAAAAAVIYSARNELAVEWWART